MIKVGINDDVFIKAVSFDDKNAIHITFSEANKKELNDFERLQADDVIETEPDMEIRIFGTKVSEKAEHTAEKKQELVVSDLNKTKGQLQHIMTQYMVKEQAVIGTHFYDGTGITADNYQTKLLEQGVVDQINKNMANFFISAMRPYTNNKSLKFRLLLVRQSKDKHFATLRGRYLEANPFLESMDVPAAQTKVAFTKYELDNKLDDGTPVDRSTADGKAAPNTTPATQADVDAAFGDAS
jgi:hypothetical protein